MQQVRQKQNKKDAMGDTMSLMQGYLNSRHKSLHNLEQKEMDLIHQLKGTQQLHNNMLQQ